MSETLGLFEKGFSDAESVEQATKIVAHFQRAIDLFNQRRDSFRFAPLLPTLYYSSPLATGNIY